jgi:hypothetical protein
MLLLSVRKKARSPLPYPDWTCFCKSLPLK